jgi:hypothetical protein
MFLKLEDTAPVLPASVRVKTAVPAAYVGATAHGTVACA